MAVNPTLLFTDVQGRLRKVAQNTMEWAVARAAERVGMPVTPNVETNGMFSLTWGDPPQKVVSNTWPGALGAVKKVV